MHMTPLAHPEQTNRAFPRCLASSSASRRPKTLHIHCSCEAPHVSSHVFFCASSVASDDGKGEGCGCGPTLPYGAPSSWPWRSPP